MAEGASSAYDVLAWDNTERYLTEGTLPAANAIIVNYHRNFGLSSLGRGDAFVLGRPALPHQEQVPDGQLRRAIQQPLDESDVEHLSPLT